MAVGDEAVVGDLNVVIGATVHGVVLQKMRHRGDVAQIVDRHNLDLGIFGHCAEHQAADAAESVDAYLDCHAELLSQMNRIRPFGGIAHTVPVYLIAARPAGQSARMARFTGSNVNRRRAWRRMRRSCCASRGRSANAGRRTPRARAARCASRGGRRPIWTGADRPSGRAP